MRPLILNSPESMVKVRVITLKDYSEPTFKTLHKLGVLHIEESKELPPVDKAAVERQQKEANQLLTIVGNMLGYISEKQQVSIGEDAEVIYTKPFDELGKEVRSLYTKFAELHEKTVKIDNEVEQLTEQKKYLGAFAHQHGLKLRDLGFSGDYLFSRVFILATETYETLHNQLDKYLLGGIISTVENETVVYAISKVENREALESLVTNAGGRILAIPDEDLTLKEFLARAEDKLHRLEEKLAQLNSELESKAGQELRNIALLRLALIAENQRLSVLTRACEAKYVTLIEGWVPQNNVELAIVELKENIDYVFIDTRQPESSEEPPTKLKNPTMLKPFQLVVTLFGTPRYREWDPTPVVAYSFAIFFGLMVADVGYAIGLILLSRFLLVRLLGGSESEEMKLFQRLIYICGGVALVMGLLSGSYLGDVYTFFGFENLAVVAGVQQVLQNPLTFVMLALMIGLVHVNIAHVMVLIKGIKERNQGAILGKVGLILVQLGIPFILRTMLKFNIPLIPPQMLAVSPYVMGAGVVLIIVGSFKQSGGIGAILWLFDVTGLLGDIMSYTRIAGVGLATFYLAAAFNMLARLFSGFVPIAGVAGVVGGAVLAIIILLVGHLINMLLSLITGFIHSLRLCFVEFLIKFYEGGGVQYSPFKLRKRPSVLVGAKS
jgi:V/A-type H+-transporting ATPase subunit I